MSLDRVFRWLIALALIPSLIALWPRFVAERPGPVVLAMDYSAVLDDARTTGQNLEQVLLEYQSLGVGGIAVTESNVRNLVDQGQLVYQSGANLKLDFPESPFEAGWYYLQGATSTLNNLVNLWEIPTRRFAFAGREWLGAPFDVAFLPAGYDPELLQSLKAQGFYLLYRPFNYSLRKLSPNIIPAQADAIAFSGTDVLGNPKRLEQSRELLQKPIAWIEGTPQEGFGALAGQLPVLRLFSLRQEWLLKLKPAEAADKFVLAARERGHQILYIRPFTYPEDTKAFLQRLVQGLQGANIAIEAPQIRNFEPSPLRYAALVGLLAGLGLLALGYPSPFGWPLALLLVLGCLGVARSDAGPLLAALVFPVLGFLEKRPGMQLWVAATLYSLAGVVFLTALGSDPASVMGLEAFRGVSLTLVVPPALVALSFLPKLWKPAVQRLWDHPIKLGEVGLALAALAVLAIVVLRRGNDAPIVPDWELQLRAVLQDVMVRPRFKELFAHALAPIALLIPWPQWIKMGLLVLIAVGEASILNTFSHYHTPLSISLFRVINGIVIGLALGFVGLWVVRRVRRWWLG